MEVERGRVGGRGCVESGVKWGYIRVGLPKVSELIMIYCSNSHKIATLELRRASSWRWGGRRACMTGVARGKHRGVLVCVCVVIFCASWAIRL